MLDERILRWFLPPSVEEDQRGKWLLRRLLKTSGNVVKRVLGRVFGMQLMDEVESFFLAMAGMREEFRRRSEEVRGLMSGPETSFLLVTSASEVGRREAIYFHKQIVQRRLPFAGFVVNRVHLPIEDSMSRQEHRPHLLRQASALLRGPAGTGEEPPVEEDELERLIQALQENALRVNRLAEQDRSLVRRLLDEAKCSTAPLFVPLLPEEAGDLDGLRRFAGFLTALVPDAPPSCG